MNTKNFTVKYFTMEATDDEYFINMQNNFESLLESKTSEKFEQGVDNYVWKVNSSDDIAETKTFFVILIKEKFSVNAISFNNRAEVHAIEPIKNDDGLGELYYAYINPARKIILTLSATKCAADTAFKKLLTEISFDGGVKLDPMFKEDALKMVLLWDFYKQIYFSFQFPTSDDLTEFLTSKEGKFFNLSDELGSLKFDMTFSAPKEKQVLNAAQVRDAMKALFHNDFCTKLIVKGADFEAESIETINIKNAQIKYAEECTLSGKILSDNEAKGILRRAFNDNIEMLLSKKF